MDKIIIGIDRALRVLTHAKGPVPVSTISHENRVSIALMRVNYGGEVAAQGLYLGAWLMSPCPKFQDFCVEAMSEEMHHLDWCGNRVQALGGRVSYANPLWFTGALLLGGLSSLAGEKYALGFVAETEKQVLGHLKSHLERLPVSDEASRSIVKQMIKDEQAHQDHAHALGGVELPNFANRIMSGFGRVLTGISYLG